MSNVVGLCPGGGFGGCCFCCVTTAAFVAAEDKDDDPEFLLLEDEVEEVLEDTELLELLVLALREDLGGENISFALWIRFCDEERSER